MQAQMGLLSRMGSTGAVQSGWKAGLSTAAARRMFGHDVALVGFLLDTTRIANGAEVGIGEWTAPRAEAELALRLRVDVGSDVDAPTALAAVEAVAPAIELVDLSPPPEDLVDVLSGNIFHRHWLTGTFDGACSADRIGMLTGQVDAMGQALPAVTDVEALTGPAGAILAEVARTAARHGRGLRAGDIVILGSIVPPATVAPGGTFRYELSGHDPVEVTFTR
jgi:2-keto-4-pentenoate hydratase